MDSVEKVKLIGHVKFTIIMIVVPILYIVGVYLIFDISLTELRGLNPSEVGDFLAGVFSPLAFYFLVLGYAQNSKSLKIQATELAASNKAFTAQVEEMRKSAEAQERMFKLEVDKLNAEKDRERQKAIPKLLITASPVSGIVGTFFILTLSAKDETSICNLTLKSISWEISYKGSSAYWINVPKICKEKSFEVRLSNMGDDSTIWDNSEHLTFEFYNDDGQKFTEKYFIEEPEDTRDPVILSRIPESS